MRSASTVHAAFVMVMRPLTTGPAAASTAIVGLCPAAGPARNARAASTGEA